MKKRMLSMVLAAILLLTVSVFAVTPRYEAAKAILTFSGTTAICRAAIITENSTDAVSVIMTLKQGSRVVDTWTVRGNGSMDIVRTAACASGLTYTLTVSAMIAGQSQPQSVTTATCP